MAASKRLLQSATKSAFKAVASLVCGATFRHDSRNAARKVKDPRRILLLSGAHIGDIVIATSVIPILRNAYPSAEIGFACGSWSRMVVKDHPELLYTHCVDHWRFNRSEKSLYRKVLQFMSTRRTALREIRKVKYDVAISLFTKFPDLLDIGWQARIPVRIAFRQSIFSFMATDLVDDPESPFVHQGARFAELLRALPIEPSLFRLRHSTLPPSSKASIQELCSLLQVSRPEDARYRIVHMGAGAAYKEFPVEFWKDLAEKLSPGCTLVFTGRGEREKKNIAAVIGVLGNCIDACDQLSWGGFVAAVRYAELLYSVDSMAGHVAGAVGTPCVAVYAGAAGVARWRPEGRDSIVFTNHVPCAPCHLPLGCAAMTCIRGVSPEDLIHLSPSPERKAQSSGMPCANRTAGSRS